MSKRAEEAALKAHPICTHSGMIEKRRAERRRCHKEGYEQAEKDLIPLINRLCEAILFEWEDQAELAWKIQGQIKDKEYQIKEETK